MRHVAVFNIVKQFITALDRLVKLSEGVVKVLHEECSRIVVVTDALFINILNRI